MQENATLWEHLEELRKTLISISFVIVIGFVCAFYFNNEILAFFKSPLEKKSAFEIYDIKTERIINTLPSSQIYITPYEISGYSEGIEKISHQTYRIPSNGFIEYKRPVNPNNLIILSPIEGVATSFKVSFWVGLVATSPLWLFLLAKFIIPALHDSERKTIGPFLALSTVFLFGGLCFAFFVTLPLANQYLLSFNSPLGINLWSLSQYLDYTLILLLANGLAFEMALLLFILVHFHLLSAESLIAKRRHMIVLAFIVGAILTPPDVLTQFLLAIPLIVLYELGILYARLRVKTKNPGLRSRQSDNALM